jgi:hypothetical protein
VPKSGLSAVSKLGALEMLQTQATLTPKIDSTFLIAQKTPRAPLNISPQIKPTAFQNLEAPPALLKKRWRSCRESRPDYTTIFLSDFTFSQQPSSAKSAFT